MSMMKSVTDPVFLSGIKDGVSKADFYQLYKAFSYHYHIDMLALLDINTWPDKLDINTLIVTTNRSDEALINLNELRIAKDNIMFSEASSSIIPLTWSEKDIKDILEYFFPFDGNIVPECAITFPIHTPTAQHYMLLGLVKLDNIKDFNLAQAYYHSILIFQKLNEMVLLPEILPKVTLRETQILKWSAQGKTSQEIADMLNLSAHTINSYIARIQRKFQVNNRTQMVATAIRTGII